MIEIRCCHSLAEAERWRDAMNALNLASPRPDPFSTFEFYRHHLGHPDQRAYELWLLLAFESDRLVGYAALRRGRRRLLGWPWSKLEWLTAHDTDRPHLVTEPGCESAVASAVYAYLLARSADWDLLEFQQQEAGSPLTPPPEAARGRFRARAWPNLSNGTIAVRWPRLADYLAALPRKSRSNIGRQMRNLLAAGEVEALASSDPAALEPLFELYRAIEPRSWKAEARAVTGRDAQSIEYWRALMEGRTPMRVWIQLLLLDGVPVSGLICGMFQRTLYALQIVHDERLARLGPGSAALLMGVRRAIEGGYAAFDLLRGSGYYKTRWLARMTDTHSVQVFRAASPVFWRRALGDALRALLAPLRPRLTPLFNPVRRRLAAASARADGGDAAPRVRPQYAALVARARERPGEYLCAAALRAALPFGVRGD